MNVVGLSRGLITGWNESLFPSLLESTVLNSGIVVDLFAKKLGKSLRLINVYGDSLWGNKTLLGSSL